MQFLGSRIKYNKNISLRPLRSLYNPKLGFSNLPLLCVDGYTWNKQQRVLAWKLGGVGVEYNLNTSALRDACNFFNFWKPTDFSGCVILMFE